MADSTARKRNLLRAPCKCWMLRQEVGACSYILTVTERGGSASGGFYKELHWERVPDGAQRSRSTGMPGYERDLLRDRSGNLLGRTESCPADMDEALRSHG